MKKGDIATIIKSHPEISYEEGWKQALQAGLCRVDFEGAWAAARRPGAEDDPDQRVQKIQGEMRRLRKWDWSLGDWKVHFAGKGVVDEECALAFALFHAQESLGRLSTVWMRRMAALLAILSVLFGLWLGTQTEGNSVAGAVWTLLSLVSYFVCFLALGAQFRGNALKIVEHELGVEPLDPEDWLSKRKGEGFGLLGFPESQLIRLARIRYGARTTYFGEYVHQEGESAYGHSVSRFLVAQELAKGHPALHCVREWRTSTSLFKTPIETGNPSFDKVFTCFSENAPKALALLGKGAASILLEKGAREAVKSFEVVDGFSIMLFAPISLETDIRFAGPLVRFDDYRRIKNGILGHLDLAARINDCL